MPKEKSVGEWMHELGLSLDTLVARSGLDPGVLRKIVAGGWTPSPAQRQKVAAALGVPLEQIAWGHSTSVEHLYGHGPQFGRSP
jgi:transcriptional regulator with XRE-family HTH domain